MTAYDVGLLILRVVLGLTLAAHGYNKFFGGGRIPGTAGWFESIGMKNGKFQAVVAASTEISAGLGLAAGFLTPIPAAGFVALMFVAAWTVHRPNGFFIVKEGWEYNLVLATGAVAVATIGPGQYSLDWLIFGSQLAQRLARPADLAAAGPGRRGWSAVDLLPAAGQTGSVAAVVSRASTSSAARSPERMAPSTHPHMTAELSVPAQWMRPHGSRRV